LRNAYGGRRWQQGWDCTLFVASCERSREGFARCEKSIGKKEGLAITLARAIIASPHDHEE